MTYFDRCSQVHLMGLCLIVVVIVFWKH